VKPIYLYSHGSTEAGEVVNLTSEDQVTELCERQKHDEEHDRETEQVLGRRTERLRQLGHCLVEADVFEDLCDTKRMKTNH